MKYLRDFLPALALLTLLLTGCAYGVYEDTRSLDIMRDDQAMAKGIKAELLKEDFSDALSVSVYCFYGHVFLVGEIPPSMQAKALAVARSFHPLSVTPHWFSAAKNERGDLTLAADLRAALIGAKGLSSTRVDTEVNAGRVVLLGVVKDDKEKQLAIHVARRVKGVTSVTSYLMLPPRAPAQP